MKYLADYHVHTDNSFDSTVKMQDCCQRAVEIGLKEIAFTEHYDLNPLDAGLGCFNPEKYFREINECREKFAGRLIIKSGLELGEGHLYQKEHTDFLDQKEFDFLLGSVHFIGPELLCREYKEDEDERAVYLEYFEEVLKVAEKGNFHALGHLDVLKRYVPERFRKFQGIDYQEIIQEILKVVIRRDKGIEVNTSGYRQGLNEPLPSVEIIKWYRELGGEVITLGSDSHCLEHLGYGLSQGVEILQDLGFKGIYTFTQGKPKFISFY